MNTSIHAGATAAVAALLGASLAGCGGGTGEDIGPIGAAPAAMYQGFNGIAEYCGLPDRLPVVDEKNLSLLVPYSTARRYSWSSEYASVALAANGWRPFPDAADATLAIPFRDFRSATPTAAWVDPGFATNDNRKGVQLHLEIPAGGIACVAPAAWLVPAGTRDAADVDPRTGRPYVEYLRTLQWESRERTPLPVETLPGYPVDAFELAANYTPRVGKTFFSAVKGYVADQSAVQVCHLPVGSNTWNCRVPTITDRGTAWLFTVDGAAPGNYVLVSAHSGARL